MREIASDVRERLRWSTNAWSDETWWVTYSRVYFTIDMQPACRASTSVFYL